MPHCTYMSDCTCPVYRPNCNIFLPYYCKISASNKYAPQMPQNGICPNYSMCIYEGSMLICMPYMKLLPFIMSAESRCRNDDDDDAGQRRRHRPITCTELATWPSKSKWNKIITTLFLSCLNWIKLPWYSELTLQSTCMEKNSHSYLIFGCFEERHWHLGTGSPTGYDGRSLLINGEEHRKSVPRNGVRVRRRNQVITIWK